MLVCQGRAAAHGRIAVGRFDDPVAYTLLRPGEREVVDLIRAGRPPSGWGERLQYELVRGAAAMMAARSVAVDDAIRERAAPQVVVVGAGLDGRAWRMPELAQVAVFEVDRPEPSRDKRQRLAGRPALAARVVFVTVARDFADLDGALAAAGHDAARPTTWVWEGVVPYLEADAVHATLARLAARSPAGSRVVVNYQERSLRAPLMRLLVRGAFLLGGRRSPWAAEPWRSTWTVAGMHDALRRAGFHVQRDLSVITCAKALDVDLDHRGDYGRVVVADH